MVNVPVGHGDANDIYKVHALEFYSERIKMNPFLRGNRPEHWTHYAFLCSGLPAKFDADKSTNDVQCRDCLRILSSRLSLVDEVG